MEPNNGKIYAILDTVADTIIGGLTIHKHDAAAIRFFADVASMPDSRVGQHPHDYNLMCLGCITTDNTIEADDTLILSGASWAAAQKIKLEV